MPKVCQICEKGTKVGSNISHSMRHTKRTFEPNLKFKRIHNNKTGEMEKKRVCMKCLKTSAKIRVSKAGSNVSRPLSKVKSKKIADGKAEML